MLKKYRTRSGLNFVMDEESYDSISQDELAYDKMESHIMSGEYFPQIMRFVGVLILLFIGKFDFLSILLVNLCVGVCSTLLWFAIPLYKIPGISLVITLIGQTIFRLFLHFVCIVILSLTVFGDWIIIIFSLIAGIIASTLNSLIFGYRFSINRNNAIAQYLLK